jgi:hypothetical protein
MGERARGATNGEEEERGVLEVVSEWEGAQNERGKILH